MKMDSLKTQKKRKKGPRWVITEVDLDNTNISNNKGFTIYETDSVILAVPEKIPAYHSVANNGGKLTKQQKRKLKKQGSSVLKKLKLKSSQDPPQDDETVGDNNEVMNGLTHEDGSNDERENQDDEEDEGVEKNEDDEEDEGVEENDVNEITEEQNTQIETSEINTVVDEGVCDYDVNEIEEQNTEMENNEINNTTFGDDDVDDDDDIETMMDKILHSDSESVVSSVDFNGDLNMSTGDSEYNKRHQFKKSSRLYFELYKVENENKYILHLPVGSKLHFGGKLRIKLLYGNIKVFGYSQESGFLKNQTLDLYTPRRCMQLRIAAKKPFVTDEEPKVLEMMSSEYKLSVGDFEKLTHSFNRFNALVLIERLHDKCSLILNHYSEVDIFLGKEIAQKGDPHEKTLGCFLDKTDIFHRRGFTVGHLWSKINPKDRTIVCGGKGVGKSTLVKFLINSKLTRSEAVLCLDLDPGQPEFTMPGCLSAVVVKKPLFGPNFTHITTPTKMAYIGHVNVGLDPVKYMRAVNYIVQSCRKDPELSYLPWFINTMGFNKGIGMDIMVNIIKLIQPDKVVQIISSQKSKNYEINLSPELVEKQPVLPLIPVKYKELKYTLYTLPSCSRTKGIGFQGGFIPAELREFMIVSYFAQAISFPYCSLNAVQPRWVHFSKISIAVDAIVQPNYILNAINGNLVGLCNIDEVECQLKSIAVTESNNSYLKIAIQPEVAPCFGIGLVRGIDIDQEKIYIITPISNEYLEKVSCLYLGNIGVPSSFYLKQKYVNVPKVYTDVQGLRNVRSVKQTFKYIPQPLKRKPK